MTQVLVDMSPPPYFIFNAPILPTGLYSNANYQISLGKNNVYSFIMDNSNGENYIAASNLFTGEMADLYRAGAASGSIPNICYMQNNTFVLWTNNTGQIGAKYTLGQCPPDYWKYVFDLIPDGAILNILLSIKEGALLTKKCLNSDGTLNDNSIIADCSPDNVGEMPLFCTISMDPDYPALISTNSGFAFLSNSGVLSGLYGTLGVRTYFCDADSVYVCDRDNSIYRYDLASSQVTSIINPVPSYRFIGIQSGFLIFYNDSLQQLYTYSPSGTLVDTAQGNIINTDGGRLVFCGNGGIITLGFSPNSPFYLDRYQRFSVTGSGQFIIYGNIKYMFGVTEESGLIFQPFYRNGEVGIMFLDSQSSTNVKMFLLTSPYDKLTITKQTGFLRCGC